MSDVDVRGHNRQQKGLEIAATSKIARKGGAWLDAVFWKEAA